VPPDAPPESPDPDPLPDAGGDFSAHDWPGQGSYLSAQLWPGQRSYGGVSEAASSASLHCAPPGTPAKRSFVATAGSLAGSPSAVETQAS